MDKAILVMDMPDDCIDCQLVDSEDEICLGVVTNDMSASKVGKYYCGYYYTHGKPDWCPLVEMPTRKHVNWTINIDGKQEPIKDKKAEGWNACLDALEGR